MIKVHFGGQNVVANERRCP